MSAIYLGVEDELSETIGESLLRHVLGNDISITRLRQNGSGYLKSKMADFRRMAHHGLVVVLTDLDNWECAPSLRDQWIGNMQMPGKLIFRVAVREIEAWLLADRQNFANYLSIASARIPASVESIPDPKRVLLNLARKASREIRRDILPTKGSASLQGLGYNERLCEFVAQNWSITNARENSPSLARAILNIERVATQN